LATDTIRETLTPEDVESKTFTPVRLREGYDMAEVDHFLDEVVATLRKAAADREGQRRQAARDSPGLNGTPPAAGSNTGSNTGSAAGEDGRHPDTRPMSAGEATSAAVRVLQLAEDEAAQLRATAAREAEQTVSDARRQAAELAEQSEAQAARVTAESEQRAGELDEQTGVRRTELLGAIEAERARLADDVDGLRAFEREYRSRLRTYLQDQIGRLDEEAGPTAATAGEPGTDGPSGP